MTKLRMGGLLLCLSTVAAAQVLASGADPEQVKRVRGTRSCPSCDLADAQLAGLNAELGDLTNANLSGAYLYKAILRHADLSGASLTGADLSGADLRSAKGANLAGATTDARTVCPNGTAGPCS